MVKISVPSELSRSFIGFDELFNSLPKETTYPPYDLVNCGNDQYELRLAVAGFYAADLEVVYEDGFLTVRTKTGLKKPNPDSERGKTPFFIYKGIAKRDFLLKWKLMETIEVRDVNLSDGILTITMVNVVPESKKPKFFEIGRK